MGCGRRFLETTLKSLFRCLRTSVCMGCGRIAGGLGTSALGRVDQFAEPSTNGRSLRMAVVRDLPMKHIYVRFQWFALYSRRGPAWALKHTRAFRRQHFVASNPSD